MTDPTHDSQGPADAGQPRAAVPPPSIAPVVRGLHHVAIAVPSIDAATELYGSALGMAAPHGREHVPDQRVDVLVLFAGGQRIELVEPASDDSPISKFLERSGGRAGLHHLAWHVADVKDAIARVRANGVTMIDDEPRDGSHGTRIAFIHPKSTGGVLMELVEDPAAPLSVSP